MHPGVTEDRDVPMTRGASVLHQLASTIGFVPQISLHEAQGFEEDTPAPNVPAAVDQAAVVREGNGRIQIFGELARGGMGVILKGRDLDLGRDLVVKVLLKKHRDNADLVRRFVEEAQIAGQLQHPGIVPVYEIGTFIDGRPFFSMKLVKGKTLADLMNQRPEPTTELARYLGIFESICQTVAYAHARGVIHRDLKPSNIMVGAFGEVQVMDWGLAKLITRGGIVANPQVLKSEDATVISTGPGDSDGSKLSQAGSIKGTPAYMSPEQARGEIHRVDERTDVFALGSILCVILTGHPAFTGRTTGEIQRKAALGDLAEALTRLDQSGMGDDLIGLVKECLSPEPEDRPRDASAVAERISAYLVGVQELLRASELANVEALARAEEEAKRRILADELAIEAQRRLGEEKRRRRATLALAASLLVLFALGGSGMTWYSRQRMVRSNRLEGLLAQVEFAVKKAEGAADSQASAEWQAARITLGQANEVGSAGMLEPQRTRLLRIQDRIDRVGKMNQLRDRLGEVRTDLVIHRDMDRTENEFVAAFGEAGLNLDTMELTVAGQALAGYPSTVEIIAGLDYWAERVRVPLAARSTQSGAGRFDPATLFQGRRRLSEIARVADPDPFRNRLRKIMDTILLDRARSPKEKFGIWQAKLGVLLKPLEDDPRTFETLPPASLQLFEMVESLAGRKDLVMKILGRAVRSSPNDFWLNINLAMSDYDDQRHLHGRPGEALRYFTAANAIRPGVAGVHNNLGALFTDLDRLEEAVVEYKESLRLRPSSADSWYNLGVTFDKMKNSKEAMVAYQKAIDLKPENILAWSKLAEKLSEVGQIDAASAAFEEAIRRDPGSFWPHLMKARTLSLNGRNEEALAEARQAVKLNPSNDQAHHALAHALNNLNSRDVAILEIKQAIAFNPGVSHYYADLAGFLRSNGNPEAALDAALTSVKLNPNLALTQGELGLTLLDLGRWADSIVASRRSLDLDDHQAWVHNNLAYALEHSGLTDEAEKEYRKAIALPGSYGTAFVNLDKLLTSQGRTVEAIALLRQMLRTFPKDPYGHTSLASLQRKAERWDEAIALARQAVQVDPSYVWAHQTLAWSHLGKRDWDNAILEYSATIRLKSDDPVTHNELGDAFSGKGDLIQAIAEYRKATELQPSVPLYHANLGVALLNNQEYEASIQASRRALALDSRLGYVHNNEAVALGNLGRKEEAIQAYGLAISLDPKLAIAYKNLAAVYRSLDRHAEVAATLQKATDAGLDAAWLTDQLAQARLFERVMDRFPALLRGDEQPANPEEGQAMGTICHAKGLSAAAVPFFARAFEDKPSLVEDLNLQARYNAACIAAVAGTGRSKDQPPPDQASQAALRSRALQWLGDDFKAWQSQLETKPTPDRANIIRSLKFWRSDTDLAGVRDELELAKLAEDERKAWLALWKSVDTLIAKAEQSSR